MRIASLFVIGFFFFADVQCVVAQNQTLQGEIATTVPGFLLKGDSRSAAIELLHAERPLPQSTALALMKAISDPKNMRTGAPLFYFAEFRDVLLPEVRRLLEGSKEDKILALTDVQKFGIHDDLVDQIAKLAEMTADQDIADLAVDALSSRFTEPAIGSLCQLFKKGGPTGMRAGSDISNYLFLARASHPVMKADWDGPPAAPQGLTKLDHDALTQLRQKLIACFNEALNSSDPDVKLQAEKGLEVSQNSKYDFYFR